MSSSIFSSSILRVGDYSQIMPAYLHKYRHEVNDVDDDVVGCRRKGGAYQV